MKRLLFILTILMAVGTLSAQKANNTTPTEKNCCEAARYKLYPTTNIWTFLKLDTRTGKVWQVQWSTEYNKRFECVLNENSLVRDGEETDGRFELYPTSNNYNFIMLDRLKGYTYQVQWSLELENRIIVPIKIY